MNELDVDTGRVTVERLPGTDGRFERSDAGARDALATPEARAGKLRSTRGRSLASPSRASRGSDPQSPTGIRRRACRQGSDESAHVDRTVLPTRGSIRFRSRSARDRHAPTPSMARRLFSVSGMQNRFSTKKRLGAALVPSPCPPGARRRRDLRGTDPHRGFELPRGGHIDSTTCRLIRSERLGGGGRRHTCSARHRARRYQWPGGVIARGRGLSRHRRPGSLVRHARHSTWHHRSEKKSACRESSTA